MNAGELFARLETDPMERLKWRVLRSFGVLPYSTVARELTDEDFIVCGAHMVLDGRQTSGTAEIETESNSAFDEKAYMTLSEVNS